MSAEQAAAVRACIERAQWVDGNVTSGHQSAQAKYNEQLPEDSPATRELGATIVAALERSALFMSAALPKQVFPPLFNRYSGGMAFGSHVDNAIRVHAPSRTRLRTDLSATLFLTPPEDYDGGELLVEDTYGVHSVKLPAGHLVLYPSTSLHHVRPVTRGARVAGWPSPPTSHAASRRLKRAHLLRWRPRPHARRTRSTPRGLPSGAASHLNPFEPSARFSQPASVSSRKFADRRPGRGRSGVARKSVGPTAGEASRSSVWRNARSTRGCPDDPRPAPSWPANPANLGLRTLAAPKPSILLSGVFPTWVPLCPRLLCQSRGRGFKSRRPRQAA